MTTFLIALFVAQFVGLTLAQTITLRKLGFAILSAVAGVMLTMAVLIAIEGQWQP